jgi:hypothetical protein
MTRASIRVCRKRVWKFNEAKSFFRLPKDPLEDLITHDPAMDSC